MNGVFKKILGVFVFVMIVLLLPNNVKAAKMSDEFKSFLNENGEFEINASKGTTEEDLALYLDFTYSDLPYSVCWDKIADDLNSFELGIYCWDDNGKEERHTVNIKYNYDEKVNKVVNEYLNSTLKDKTMFKVSDLELVSYWLNTNADNHSVLALYSGELKKLLDYKNIEVFADGRAGGNDYFISSNMGFGSFQSDGIIYKMVNSLGATAEHVIYIDESVGNTKEEVVAAVQKRIDDYFGKGNVTIEFAGEGIYDLYMDEYEWAISYYQQLYDDLNSQYQEAYSNVQLYCDDTLPNYDENMCNQWQSTWGELFPQVDEAKMQLDSNKDYKNYFIEKWNDKNGEYKFLKDAYNDWYFFAHMQFGDLMFSPFFVVKKDSSKMVEPIVKTVDSATNIEISTTENLPLDTMIQATELTSGKEYERIVKLLNVDDNLTFDLKLYSNSLGEYVTKLDNGTFEVKIPLPENFKNRNLKVYYVGSSNKPEEFKVEVKDGYAIFNTDHFSIYTLAAEGEAINENVPNTFDGIVNYIIIGVISLIVLVGAIVIYVKTRKRTN